MRKINRKTADPEILQAYEEMRYERRYPKLDLAINVFRGVAYLGVMPVFFIPEGMRQPWIKVWMVVVAIALVMELTLMVAWQPRGRRMKTFLLIVGVLVGAVIMLASFYAAMGMLLKSQI